MSLLLIRMSLYLLAIHLTKGYWLPKFEVEHPTKLVYKDKDGGQIKISNPEKATVKEITYYHIVEKPYYPQEENNNSEETTESGEFPIDVRAEQNNNNTAHHDESKIHFGREKREVSLEEPDYTQKDKQSNKLKQNQTKRFKRTFYTAYLDDDLDCDDEIFNTISDDYDHVYYVEVVDSNFIEDQEVEEEDDDDDIDSYIEDDKSEEHEKISAEDEEISIDREHDTVSDSEKDSKSFEPCEDDKNYEEPEEDINSRVIDDVLDKITSITEPVPSGDDNTENRNVDTLIHDIFQSQDEPIDAALIKTASDKSPYINVLKGIFTNIVKDNIFITGNIPDIIEPIDIIAAKDKTDDNEKPAQTTEKSVFDANLKDQETTTKKYEDKFTPSDIEYSKNKDFTSSKSNTDQNLTSFDENDSHKTTTEKVIQVVLTTHPIVTEASTQENEEAVKATPTDKDESLNKKPDSGDVNQKIDRVLDLVKNDQFWKFMGDFGGKYLESLIARSNSLIKEEIINQVKEHLNALKKEKEKKKQNPVLEKEKDIVKEDKPKIDNNIELVSEKYNDSTTNSKEKNSGAKEHTDTLSTNKHINTADGKKVTNVYVFYPSDNIDEIIKHIHQITNKNKGTNLYTFGSNENGHEKDEDSKISDNDNKPNTIISPDGDYAHANKINTAENTIKSTTEQTPNFTTSTVALVPEKDIVTESINKQPTTEKDFLNDTTTESHPSTESTTKIYTNPTTEPAIETTTSDDKIATVLEKTIETTTEKGPFITESVATKDTINPTTVPAIDTTISLESKTTETATEMKTTESVAKIEENNNYTTESPHTSKPTTEVTTEKELPTTESVATKDGTVIEDSNPTMEPSTTVKDISKDSITESKPITTESVTSKGVKDKDGTDNVTNAVINDNPTTEASNTPIETTLSDAEKVSNTESTTEKDVSKDNITESNPLTTESVTPKGVKDKDGTDNVTNAVINDNLTTESASTSINTQSTER